MSARALTICAIGAAGSTHVVTRVGWFAKQGHRVYLITETRSIGGIDGVTELAPSLEALASAAFPLRVLGWFLRRLRLDHAWRMIAFVRLLRACRPDIVHVHFAHSYYGWLAGLAGCRPLVVTVMGGDILFDEQGSPTAFGKWLTLLLLRRADYITSKSDYLISVLDRLGGFGSKAERVVWGTSVAQFRRSDAAALRSALGLRPEQRVILSPKILQPLYRVHLLVEAMIAVARSVPDAVLLVTEYAADPGYKAGIVERVAKTGLGQRVRFCGHVDHGAMPGYYSLAEITVAVPSSDGLPQTLLEGMACEVPNILSRLARYEEIVRHGESAYFVDATAEGIADGIVKLLNDSGLRDRIARNALQIARRDADLDEQARRVERRYRELAESIPRRAFSLCSFASAARQYFSRRGSPDL